ncbi:hypothetical protein PUR23_00165 [Methylorubrum populi]|uniref:hypothetical protein n=1 Tax=Methylorubrum populi TaxID=223967 RepID=UPI0031F7BAF0
MKIRDQETTTSSPSLDDPARAASCRQVPPDAHGRCLPVSAPSPRALACVGISQAALAVRVADLGLDVVHMTLARDESTGLVVAAALDAARRRPVDVLGLFGDGAGTAGGLGAVWPCLGVPEVIVVDHAVGYHDTGFHEAAWRMGIQVLHWPARALPGQAHLNALLGRSGSCRDGQGRSAVTMAALVGAVHAWIAACYASPRGRDVDAVRTAPPAVPPGASRAHAWTLRGKAGRNLVGRMAAGRR